MKNVILIVFGMLFGLIIATALADNPTPHQCMSVCVEEFEKFGC